MATISFDLHKLGWKAFEDLVICIFRDVMGQTFQSFSEGKDGGRDGAFHGNWSPTPNETWSGSFTIQCKHTSKSEHALTSSVTKGELNKIKVLAEKGLADNYILVTNHTLPAGVADALEQSFRDQGVKQAKVYGAEWIAQIIQEKPKLRRLVPRIYGLGDLTQIITHQAYRQTQQVLESFISDELSCFVPTEAYRKCAHVLQEHGFVLLIGEPASGKTMIANLMALSAADEWEHQTIMLSKPEEFSKQWNPDDPRQFLWVDDAFGATQYDSYRVQEWNHLLPKLKSAIRAGAKVVFTSRNYIFEAAKKDLKISSFELFNDSRVTIQVEKLSEVERQMMLYNHLKLGKQPKEFKLKVKPFLPSAAATPKFLPEVARRFGNPKFTKNLHASANSVQLFFEAPRDCLQDILSNLAPAEKAAIAAVFIEGGRLQVPLPEDSKFDKSIEMMQSNRGDVKNALVNLRDSFLRKRRENDREYWAFHHPTFRDAFASLVGDNPELMDIYLAGVSTEQLLKEVICGDIACEGAKIIIPPEQYHLIIERLREFKSKFRYSTSVLLSFLADRCADSFLKVYYQEESDLVELIPTYIFSIYCGNSALKILKRLHSSGMLPEHIRAELEKSVFALCESENSVRFADASIFGDLLNQEEIKKRLQPIVSKAIFNGKEVISELLSGWQDDWDDPESVFAELQDTLRFVQKQAQNLLDKIEQIVDEKNQHIESSTEESLSTENATTEIQPTSRSIFDDVDE